MESLAGKLLSFKKYGGPSTTIPWRGSTMQANGIGKILLSIKIEMNK